MENETPWYLRPPTEEELRRYAADPWAGTPEHLRPQFLKSELEMKGEALMESRTSNSWMDSKLRKFLQETTDPALVVELRDAIRNADHPYALLSSTEVEKGAEQTDTAWEYWADGQKMKKLLSLQDDKGPEG